jgi:hypothetical protein
LTPLVWKRTLPFSTPPRLSPLVAAVDEKKKGKSSSATLIVRILIFGGLAVLLVLALLDYRMKHSAQGTAAAIQSAMKAKPVTDDLKLSEVPALIVGSPVIESAPLSESPDAGSRQTMTWKGIFRTYRVNLDYTGGDDPIVETIDGPVME